MENLNILLLIETVTLIASTVYIATNWNRPVTVGLNAVSLLWVEAGILLYVNLKERDEDE